jgi:hypothetical protein
MNNQKLSKGEKAGVAIGVSIFVLAALVALSIVGVVLWAIIQVVGALT